MKPLDSSAISVWCFLMKTLQPIRKPPVDHSLGCLGWSTGGFLSWDSGWKRGNAPYSLLAPAVLAVGLLSDAVLPDVSDVLWLEAFAPSEPSLPAPVAGVAEDLPRWSVL